MGDKSDNTRGYKPVHEGYQPKHPSDPQGGTGQPQGGYVPEKGEMSKPTPPKKP